ncbi:acetylcholine receptor subunit alpha-like 1 [Phymastichus coffea]|uniref:acetylcholine receptor subunit alpha-like 1 n=1 Tax=Phymastichus coffea TaxID=108790 RepID=UPI00273C8FC0|nr:acetylcholine receptor subunit alpha-like 1 [Phymastichus coffea]
MAANVWLVMSWNDDKLRWNSSDYGGLQSVNLAAHEIWLPDVYLLNSAAHGMEYYGDRHCVVSEEGMVLWVTPTIFHGYCHLDFALWPFEADTCRLSLSSWTYDGSQVDLRLLASGVELHDYVAISEWIVRNATASRREESFDCCPEAYVTLDFEFELSRSAELYYHVVFAPTVPIVLLSLLTFWLRPQSELKILINACVVLVVVLYLVYFGYKVPPRFDSMPIIVRFYSGCLYQASISMVVSAIVIHIDKLSAHARVPRPIRRLLLGRAARYLGLGHIVREIEARKSVAEQELCESHLMDISLTTTPFASLDDAQRQQQQQQQQQRHQQQQQQQQQLPPPPPPSPSPDSGRSITNLEWTLAATAIDRLVFLVFCLAFAALAICCVRLRRFTFPSDNVPYWHT